MAKFELSIKSLQNGWADLFFLLDETVFILCFENVPSDALYNLLESAIKIIKSTESSVMFPNNSQKTYLSVKLTGSNSCCIETTLCCLELSIKEFCKTILRMFDKYTFAYSKEEFSKSWHTFPEVELETLRKLYHTL